MLSSMPEAWRATLERSPLLGLSDAPNSHKAAARGAKGLTAHGRRMLRNGCYLLEKRAGKDRVAMVTATIPACAPEVEKKISGEWAEIVRTFTQALSRKLKAAHGCPWVLGCVEIQEKRLEKQGGMPLHLHCVFQSKVGRQYIVSKSDALELWKRAVCARVPLAENLYWGASTRIEKVKKSVTAYMCKYMSKGINQNVLVSVQEGYTLPSSWWFAVGGVKHEIKKQSVVSTGVLASYLWEMAITSMDSFRWIFPVYIKLGDMEYHVGFTGELSRELRRDMGIIHRSVRAEQEEFSFQPKECPF